LSGAGGFAIDLSTEEGRSKAVSQNAVLLAEIEKLF